MSQNQAALDFVAAPTLTHHSLLITHNYSSLITVIFRHCFQNTMSQDGVERFGASL